MTDVTLMIAESTLFTAAHPTGAVSVRAATDNDVRAIKAVVDENARLGHLLPRSEANIRDSLQHWLVAECDGAVVGIGSLLEMTPTLVEVRSLAVMSAYRKHGVGQAVVSGLMEEAGHRGYATIFALTRAVGFFEKLGYRVTDTERFPEKVWRDCVLCPLRHACDETAVVFEL